LDTLIEANFDGLIGPTHNYAGLSPGNLASHSNARQRSAPRQAALQGLDKMAFVAGLGLPQGFLPPHERPHLPTLRRLGFTGSDAQVIERAARDAPQALALCCSASPMWAANAATVSAGPDTADGRLHFTPANLVSMPHRAIEAPFTGRVLRTLFADENLFAHHDPVPGGATYGDEGAANHGRLSVAPADPGVTLLVYGREALEQGRGRFPARQALEASQAIARAHGLDPQRVVFARQSSQAIDAGAFHNDVVAVANGPVLFAHRAAFADPHALRAALTERLGEALQFVEVSEAQVPLALAVRSYLFNSQLLSLPDGRGMALVLPEESREEARVYDYLQSLRDVGGPIRELHFVDVRQSMRNGGGPACLRLRVPLTGAQRAAVHPSFLMDAERLSTLRDWVQRHYREQLSPGDLGDPALLDETRRALDELTQLLGVGSLYDFQRD
jgi:succinylarginine dihydrolase